MYYNTFFLVYLPPRTVMMEQLHKPYYDISPERNQPEISTNKDLYNIA